MTDQPSPSFAIAVETDAYSTAGKIMGRQMAGLSFLRGLVRAWPTGSLQGVTTGGFDREELRKTLIGSGFKGDFSLTRAPDFAGARKLGALYYPAIPLTGLARFRNRIGPAAYSLFGVTHTISSDRALDGIAALASHPFMPWDALICTSHAAKQVVDAIVAETQDDLGRHTGADRFAAVQTPIIPLGVHCDDWTPTVEGKIEARTRLGIADDEVAFLFAGRLSFHAKANPAPLYQALQAISGEAKIVLIEAGLFHHDSVRNAYQRAQIQLAPNVRFIHAAGDNPQAYADAWRAADVFASLSDNVQETFGLTPVEAMAAGLPVVVTDWNGYRSNIRDGVDGFLVPTVAAPAGAGGDLGVAVAGGNLTYDRQIGLLSLCVTAERRALCDALRRLATDRDLRRRMGAAGRLRTQQNFDWSVVLRSYESLTTELAAIRAKGAGRSPEPWPTRRDPFSRFEGFATRTIGDDDIIILQDEAESRLSEMMDLAVANYAFNPLFLDSTLPARLQSALREGGGAMTVAALLSAVCGPTPQARRALAWLFKFGMVEIGKP